MGWLGHVALASRVRLTSASRYTSEMPLPQGQTSNALAPISGRGLFFCRTSPPALPGLDRPPWTVRHYCEKWGMKAATHEHALCTLDLQKIRDKVEQRIADDMAF